jgi:hypothetical protein
VLVKLALVSFRADVVTLLHHNPEASRLGNWTGDPQPTWDLPPPYTDSRVTWGEGGWAGKGVLGMDLGFRSWPRRCVFILWSSMP